MTVDLAIRSYDGDFEWLKYCLRSIQRFATGFRRTIVIVPIGQIPPTGTAETVFYVDRNGDDYLGQQIHKLNADAFSDAEFILHLDSDCVLTRPITPYDVISDCRRVRWLFTPYSSLGDDDSQKWRGVIEKALKLPVEHEFMRRHPFCTPRWALEEIRRWFWREHGMSLERYIMAQPGREFSEWNILGTYLWFHHHDKVEWINTDEQMGVPFVRQYHSWGGLHPHIEAELEAALR